MAGASEWQLWLGDSFLPSDLPAESVGVFLGHDGWPSGRCDYGTAMNKINSNTILKTAKRSRQRGTEILEFGLVALLFVPLLTGTFVTGMNLVRSIAANQVARD